MTASRVTSVQLRLRLPAELASVSEQIRATVEREVLQRILDEVEQLLHARFGANSVIRIRRLAVNWRLGHLELASVEVMERLALDLAGGVIAELEALTADERLRPDSDSVAWFASAQHAAAAYLADIVDGRAGKWIYPRTDPHATWRAVVDAGTEAIRETAQYLVSMSRLEPALALADDITSRAVAACGPELAAIVTVVRAREHIRRTAVAIEPASGSNGPLDPGRAVGSPTPPRSTPAMAAEHNATPERGASGGARADGTHPHSGGPEAMLGETQTHQTPAPDKVIRTPDTGEPDMGVATQYAGLFYLIGRVLEIDLAERMWAAGLPEGDVLAHVAAAIITSFDDPSASWFGGVIDRPVATPEVPAWAAAEVCETMQHALGRRLVRFGVTSSPASLGDQLEHLARAVVPVVPVSPTLHRVVTRAVAALCMIVAARLGVPPTLVTLRTVCSRSGRLVRAPDVLHVILPEAAIDIDHRRAGLDQDPGNAPWLGLRVRLAFV